MYPFCAPNSPASDTPPPYGHTTPAPCRATRLPRRPLEPRPEGRPALVAQLSPRVTSGAAPGRTSQARWVESDRGFLGGWVVGMPTTHATARGGQGPYHRPLAVYPVSYRLLASPPPPRIRMLGGDVTPVWAAASQATPRCGTAAGALDPPETQ